MPNENPPKPEYEYTAVFEPPVALDEYIKKVFKLSTSPSDALHDDDWSFVIKMSAYVEVALNELLMAHFNDRRLDKIIEKMNMGSDRQGKLAFVKSLNLLSDKSWSFIDLLSELRGHIVHRVSMLNLNLAEHLHASQKKESWKLVLLDSDSPEVDKTLGDALLTYSRVFMFRMVMTVMSRTALQTDQAKLDHDLEGWMQQLSEFQIYRRLKEKPPESTPSPPADYQPEDHTGSA